jgi:hypothetical protein
LRKGKSLRGEMLEHMDTSLELLQTELSWYHTCKLNKTLAKKLCVLDQVSSRRVVGSGSTEQTRPSGG